MASIGDPFPTVQPDSFLGYSKGIDVDTRGDSTMGKLFENMGNMVSLTTKAVDEFNKREITKEITPQVDQIRDEWGAGDASTIQQDAGNNVPPEDIKRSMENLQRLRNAHQQGALQDSHYWARLDSVARQMRARYPGHRDYIDGQISGMVGTTPANALVRSLKSEAEEAGRKAQAAAGKDEAFVDAAIKAGHLDNQELQAWQAKKIPIETVKSIVAQRTFLDSKISREKAGLSLMEARGQVATKESMEIMNANAGHIVDQSLYNSTEAIGIDGAKMREGVADLLAKGTKATPEEKANLSNYFAQVETKTIDRVNQFLSQPMEGADKRSFAQRHPEEAQKILERTKARFNTYREAIHNDNYGLLASDKIQYEASLNNAKLAAIQNKVTARTAAGVAIHGQAYWGILSNNAPAMATVVKAMADHVLGGVITGEVKSLRDAHKEAVGLSDEKAASQGVSAIIKSTNNLLLDPKTPVRSLENIVEAHFGMGNRGFLGNIARGGDDPLDTQEAKAQAYNALSSAAVANRMWSLKNEGREDLWEKYRNWTNNGLYTYTTSTLSNLHDAVNNRSIYHNIHYANGQFFITPKANIPKGAATDMGQEAQYINRVVRTANQSLQPMLNIAKLEKSDPDKVAMDWARSIGIDLRKLMPPDTKMKIADDPQMQRVAPAVAGMMEGKVTVGERQSANVEDRRDGQSSPLDEATRRLDKVDNSQLGLPEPISPEELERVRVSLRRTLTPEQMKDLEKIVPKGLLGEIFK